MPRDLLKARACFACSQRRTLHPHAVADGKTTRVSQPYTEYISTRWYRAPECLLTDGYYGYKMDMWGVGCVMFEFIALFPLFPGTNEMDQIQKIHNVLGTPSKEVGPSQRAHADLSPLTEPHDAQAGSGEVQAQRHTHRPELPSQRGHGRAQDDPTRIRRMRGLDRAAACL